MTKANGKTFRREHRGKGEGTGKRIRERFLVRGDKMPGMKNKLVSSVVAAVAVAVALSAGALVNARTSSRGQQDATAAQHPSARANTMPFVVPDLADRAA